MLMHVRLPFPSERAAAQALVVLPQLSSIIACMHDDSNGWKKEGLDGSCWIEIRRRTREAGWRQTYSSP